jgi:hypothetical protein
MEGNREFFLHLRTERARPMEARTLEELLARTVRG